MEERVMIVAGGTGGHVFPALAVAERLLAVGMHLCWMGTRQGLEARLVAQRRIPIEWVSVRGLRGSGGVRWLQAPFRLSLALLQARRILRRQRPAVVLGMGGFTAGPGGIMARLLGIPLVIHEQNAVPGLTNRWLARIAARVFEAFPGSFPASRRAVCCGNPVRAAIAGLPSPVTRSAGRTGPLRLLVLGGSQGAHALNLVLPAALARLAAGERPLVRHQAGERELAVTRDAYGSAGISAAVNPFIEDMAAAYGWADLVVCRAGALTVSELAAAGVGAVLVPYPYAVDDHQTRNAAYLVDAGAAVLLPQSQLTAPALADLLRRLLGDRATLVRMAEAARERARTDAAAVVADACRELAGTGSRGQRAEDRR